LLGVRLGPHEGVEDVGVLLGTCDDKLLAAGEALGWSDPTKTGTDGLSAMIRKYTGRTTIADTTINTTSAPRRRCRVTGPMFRKLNCDLYFVNTSNTLSNCHHLLHIFIRFRTFFFLVFFTAKIQTTARFRRQCGRCSSANGSGRRRYSHFIALRGHWFVIV